MKKLWSKFWKGSSQTRKQRKYVHNAPLHIKHKLVSAGVSKELKEKHNVRSLPVRTGDTVTILSGQFKGKSGKVTKVSLARMFAHVEGAVIKKQNGSDSFYPVHPSNLQITELDLSDKLRVAKIERMNK